MTWTIPRVTTSAGSFRWIGCPSHSIVPLVTSPRSVRSSPEIAFRVVLLPAPLAPDRKSTHLNSSHLVISYAVFCLKKKKLSTRDRKSTRLHSKHCHISHSVLCFG